MESPADNGLPPKSIPLAEDAAKEEGKIKKIEREFDLSGFYLGALSEVSEGRFVF